MVGGRAADLAPTTAVKIFSAGTAGCVADLVTFPLDTAKVRLQVRHQEAPPASWYLQLIAIFSVIKSFIFYNKKCNTIQNIKKVKNWCTVGHPLPPTRLSLSCVCSSVVDIFVTLKCFRSPNYRNPKVRF